MKNEITIIYASQTGQAKAIAESIFDLASKHDLYKIKVFFYNLLRLIFCLKQIEL